MQKVKRLIAKFWAGLTTGEENKRLHDYLDLQDREWKNVLEKEYEQTIKEESVLIEENRSDKILEEIHRQITGVKQGQKHGSQEVQQGDQKILLGTREGQQEKMVVQQDELVVQQKNQEILPGSQDIQQEKTAVQQNELEMKQLPRVKITVIPGWIKWAAAVIIVMVAGWKIYQFNHKIPADQILVGMQTGHSHSKKIRRQQINRGDTPLNLKLADGSSVLLQPGAAVTYEEPFNEGDKRNISLNGNAFFQVAKDAKRPFTVYAKGFTTTALGTEFVVNAHQVNGISVKLIKGKVVVRATLESGMDMKDAYLTPGRELRINIVTKRYDIRNFNTGTRDQPVMIRKAVTPGLTDSNNLAFNKEPLLKVFTRLGIHYNVKFEYDKKEIQLLSFTGIFGPSDSLGMLLPVICNMNDLSYRIDSNKVIITRQE